MNIHWKSACLVFIYISSRCTGAPLVRNVVSDLSAADVWSSDGQWILYVKRDAEGHPQIWKLGLTSLKEVQITADPFSHAKPAWSFDGQWVCYERSDEGGFQQVCKTLSGGGQEIPVTSGQWDHCSPKWSPRDDWILLIRTDREGRTQLCKIDAEGKRMVRLTKGTGRKEGACWSPDGRWILYGAKGDNGFISLKRISSEGGEEMDVSGTEGAAGGWDWSPDGRWVVWCRRSKEEGTALLKTPVQGGDSILLSRDCMDASAPSWSPDGKWIVFVRKISVPEKASCVMKVFVSGEEKGVLSGNVPDAFSPSWSPDGLLVTFLSAEDAGESLCVVSSNGVSESPALEQGEAVPKNPLASRIPSPTPTSTLKPIPTHTPTSKPTRRPQPTAIPTSISLDEKKSPPKPEATVIPRSALIGEGLAGWGSLVLESGIRGMAVFGDRFGGDMAGFPCSAAPAKEHVFPHFYCSQRWVAAIVLVNPNPIEVEVELEALGDKGRTLRSASLRLDSFRKMAASVSLESVLGEEVRYGWLLVRCHRPIGALMLHADRAYGGRSICGAAPLSTKLAVPHVFGGWKQLLIVVNGSENEAGVKLTLRRDDGTPLARETYGLYPRGRLCGYLDDLLTCERQEGWLEMEGLGADLAALSFFAREEKVPGELASCVSFPPRQEIAFPGMKEDSSWWSGIAVANGDEKKEASVSAFCMSKGGEQIEERNWILPPGGRLVGQLSELLGPGAKDAAWVRIRSDRPLYGLQFLGARDAKRGMQGLAAMEPWGMNTAFSTGGKVERGNMLVPHWDAADRWRNLFLWVNRDGLASQSARLGLYSVGGEHLRDRELELPAFGFEETTVRQILGIQEPSRAALSFQRRDSLEDGTLLGFLPRQEGPFMEGTGR